MGIFEKLKVNRRGSKPGGFPLFSGKVRIVSRTLSGLFLVGAAHRPREKDPSGKSLDNPQANRKNPGKSGSSQKGRDEKGRTSPDREPPCLTPPPLLALEIYYQISCQAHFSGVHFVFEVFQERDFEEMIAIFLSRLQVCISSLRGFQTKVAHFCSCLVRIKNAAAHVFPSQISSYVIMNVRS